MTVAIMQPYFLPYLGYWQLMACADRFVVYDNIQYTKQGWINRNRFLRNGAPAYFTLPLKRASALLEVRQRELAPDFDRDRLLRALEGAYRRAPQFGAVFPLIERVVQVPTANLFEFVYHSLAETAAFLDLATPLLVSSSIEADHTLAGERRVLAICRALGATRYVNPAGGRALYSPQAFAAAAIELAFLQPVLPEYPQFGGPFVPGLSIVDVLMFNPREAVREMLARCDVVAAV